MYVSQSTSVVLLQHMVRDSGLGVGFVKGREGVGRGEGRRVRCFLKVENIEN